MMGKQNGKAKNLHLVKVLAALGVAGGALMCAIPAEAAHWIIEGQAAGYTTVEPGASFDWQSKVTSPYETFYGDFGTTINTHTPPPYQDYSSGKVSSEGSVTLTLRWVADIGDPTPLPAPPSKVSIIVDQVASGYYISVNAAGNLAVDNGTNNTIDQWSGEYSEHMYGAYKQQSGRVILSKTLEPGQTEVVFLFHS